MNTYHVIVTDVAKADLKRYRDYILKKFNNPQAAKDLIHDFRDTRKQLEIVAGSLQSPASNELIRRNLKRINFLKHSYFLLFQIVDETVFITNMFHFLEDYENKLR